MNETQNPNEKDGGPAFPFVQVSESTRIKNMNIDNKCYSLNEEDFSHQSIEEAVDCLMCNTDEDDIGKVHEIYEADIVKPSISHLLPCISESMEERAASQYEEYSEGWQFSESESNSLQAVVVEAVEKWIKENKKEPTFYGVNNVKSIEVKILNGDGDFEVVSIN